MADHAVVYPRAATVTVVMVQHDDWLINVLLSDGRFYTFNTEMWPEHGCEFTPDGDGPTNWPAAIRRAKQSALWYASRGIETWGLDAIPETDEQFSRAIDFVCMAADDATFHRFVRS